MCYSHYFWQCKICVDFITKWNFGQIIWTMRPFFLTIFWVRYLTMQRFFYHGSFLSLENKFFVRLFTSKTVFCGILDHPSGVRNKLVCQIAWSIWLAWWMHSLRLIQVISCFTLKLVPKCIFINNKWFYTYSEVEFPRSLPVEMFHWSHRSKRYLGVSILQRAYMSTEDGIQKLLIQHIVALLGGLGL